MVLSMSNAATGRRGRIAPRAALRTRVWAARSARAPKGSPGAIEGGQVADRRKVGKALLSGGTGFLRRISGICGEMGTPSQWCPPDCIWPAASKELGAHAAEGRGGVVGNVRKWAIAVALIGAACTKGNATEPGNSIVGPVDAGPVDAGPTVDAGPADAGPADAGPADAGGIKFGGPGPWPIGNVQYSWQDGLQEMPVVGVSTDENQNLWVATNAALYLLRPGDKTFTRFDGHSGLHLPGFPIPKCDDSAGLLVPCPAGEAAPPGINEIVGGGAGE